MGAKTAQLHSRVAFILQEKRHNSCYRYLTSVIQSYETYEGIYLYAESVQQHVRLFSAIENDKSEKITQVVRFFYLKAPLLCKG